MTFSTRSISNRSFPGRRAITTLLIALLLAVAMGRLSGCDAPSKGAGIGGAIGAGTGAVIGAVAGGGKGAAIGAAIGGALGGTAGFVYGKEADKRRAKYRDNKEALSEEIKAARAALETEQKHLEASQHKLTETQTAAATLDSQFADLQEREKQRQRLLTELDAQRTNNAEKLKNYETAIAAMNGYIDQSAADQSLAAKRTELQVEVGKLQQQYMALQDIDTKMLALRQNLAGGH